MSTLSAPGRCSFRPTAHARNCSPATGPSTPPSLPPELVTAIDAVAAREGATAFAVLVAAFAALTHEVTGTSASAAMCGVANRPEARFEKVAACFTHSSWFVVPVAEAASFTSLVAAARDAIWRRLALQSVPALDPQRGRRRPLRGQPTQSPVRALQHPDPQPHPSRHRPRATRRCRSPVARAEQTWAITVTPEGALTLVVEYATDLFDPETIAGWATRFTEILTAGVADPDSKPWHAA